MIRAVHELQGDRVVVSLHDKLRSLDRGWKQLDSSKWALKSFGLHYVDVPTSLPHEDVDRRTTLVLIGEQWILFEYSELISSLGNLCSELEHVDFPTEIITIAHKGCASYSRASE